MNWKTTFVIGTLALAGSAIIAAPTLLRAEPSSPHAAHGPGASTEAHDENEAAHGEEGHAEDAASEGLVKLTSAQVEASAIETAPASSGVILAEISVPGRIVVNADAQAEITPTLSGTVARIAKQLGDRVSKGELLAILESREMADATAEYLAATRAEELARSTYTREDRLFDLKVTSEQEFLEARNAHQSAKIEMDLAHQKLRAIGLSDGSIAMLAKSADGSRHRFYEIKSPIAGRVTARSLVLGQAVDTDKPIFRIADLSTVWIEMAVPPRDLPSVAEGQKVRVQLGESVGTAAVIAVSPVIDPETRSAIVLAELDNGAGSWKLGDYANALLLSNAREVEIVIARAAVQTIDGSSAVFVAEDGGFRLRKITTGQQDSLNVEVVSGLEFGETVAITNAFILKAELGKSEAEHEH